MKAPITINESQHPYSSGDVNFYDSVKEACMAMEPCDVSDGRYFAFDADGVMLSIRTDGKAIWLVPTDMTEGKLLDMIRDYLSRIQTPVGRELVSGYLKRLGDAH